MSASSRHRQSCNKRSHHGEERLIQVAYGLDAAGPVQAELWTCLAQSRFVLRGGKDGNVQDLACQLRVLASVWLGEALCVASVQCADW
jgi:hypothetical protein